MKLMIIFDTVNLGEQFYNVNSFRNDIIIVFLISI